jgi:altronate dehydratase small subunit
MKKSKTTNALVIDARDNIATMTQDIERGEAIRFTLRGEMQELRGEQLRNGQRFAIRPIAKGEPVIWYGKTEGYTSHDVSAGMALQHMLQNPLAE